MAGPRNILVTGGTSGIGFALVNNLSNRHRVLTTGRKLSEPLKALIKDRPDVEFLALDQNAPSKIPQILIEKLDKKNWAYLDNAILNAGTGFISDPTSEAMDIIRNTLAVNLTANVTIAHSLFPYLKENKGKLSFIGSTARKGAPNFASYAASKAALHGLARGLKEEWRGSVDVQIIHPGPTKTDMHEKAGLKLGKVRDFFADPKAMAQMIENSLARNNFSANLGLLQYWSGGQFLGRGLR